LTHPLTPAMKLHAIALLFAQVLLFVSSAPFDETSTTVLTSEGTTSEVATNTFTTDESSTGTTPEPTTSESTTGTTSESTTGTTSESTTGTTSESTSASTDTPYQSTSGTTSDSSSGTTSGPTTDTSTNSPTYSSTSTPYVTSEPTTVSTNPPSISRYCACDLDEYGMAKDWAEQLWVDMVIILDTSAAMGSDGVTESTSIIESFIARMNLDNFSTPKYSRIALITASTWPKIHYYFNMSSTSDLSNIKSEKTLEFNFVEAFKAAVYLFNFWSPKELHREQVPRVIYLITNTRPPTKIAAADQFKQDGGTIIVADFVQEGAITQPLLRDLASPGFFFTDLTQDYTKNLVVFCQINCFCPSSLKSSKPSHGCFQPMASPASFDGAVRTCAETQMDLATIHSQFDEDYLIRVKGLPHWFGLRNNEATGFSWVDKEQHNYSNWAKQEPELENNQNCAYALKGTSKKIEWFTGNCHLPFYFTCSSAPCSAERYCSEEQLFGFKKMISQI
ncbi:hypothetical protein PFISCL1PPCAC_16069, partial [Pristionchus fissidentatus]